MRRTLALLLLALCASRADAQAAAESCSYRQCALAISPVWNGLDVVGGAESRRVESLGFFLPRRMGSSFAGNDSASAYAERAFKVQRYAAFATDLGGAMLVFAAARELGSSSGSSRAIGAAG